MSNIESHSPNTITTPDGQEITNVKKLSGESSFYSSPSVGEIINDGTNDRALIGYDKDGFGTGEDWGIKVSQAGYDVKTATDSQLVMSSAFNLFKIVASGTLSISVPGGYSAYAGYSTSVTHNLGYEAASLVYQKAPAGLGSQLVQVPFTSIDALGGVGFSTSTAVTTTTLTVTWQGGGAAAYNNTTWTYRYYLLRETAS